MINTSGRFILFASIVGVSALLAPGGGAAQSVDAPYDGSLYGRMDDAADEIVVGGATADEASDGSAGRGNDIITQVALAPACAGNHPDLGLDNYELCAAATTACPPSPNGGQQLLMWRWTRQFNTATGTALSAWEIQTPVCVGWDQVEVPNVPLLVLREFQERTKLLRATVRIQPPAGRTLINFDTIFYADDPSTTIEDIPIAGASVDLRITASTYLWAFGDGVTATTTTPGHPYPSHDIVHRYTATTTVAPHVDVTYTGQYRVDGGAWLDIPGTATVIGEDVALTIVSARSQLIAG